MVNCYCEVLTFIGRSVAWFSWNPNVSELTSTNCNVNVYHIISYLISQYASLFLNHCSDILVGMLKKEKKRTADIEMSVKQGGGRIPDGMGVAPDGIRRSTSQPLSDDSESDLSNLRSAGRTRVKDRPSSDTTEVYTCCYSVIIFERLIIPVLALSLSRNSMLLALCDRETARGGNNWTNVQLVSPN